MELIVRNPMFRLLWLNGMFAQIGLMGFGMVHGWLALDVTDSVFWVGAAAGAMGLGLISFGAVAGVLADRLDRRAVVLAATAVQDPRGQIKAQWSRTRKQMDELRKRPLLLANEAHRDEGRADLDRVVSVPVLGLQEEIFEPFRLLRDQ